MFCPGWLSADRPSFPFGLGASLLSETCWEGRPAIASKFGTWHSRFRCRQETINPRRTHRAHRVRYDGREARQIAWRLENHNLQTGEGRQDPMLQDRHLRQI